jgi:ribosomal protein L14E/L6E/L27E
LAASKGKTLEYKGRPLRRKDNIIYYGSMADKYIVMLQILDTKVVKPSANADSGAQDLKIATKVSIQLQLTDPEIKSRNRVVKRSEKDSLYAAMDVASVWLERALASK